MRQLFEKLESVEAEKTSFVISALGAEHLGKKAVVSGGEVLWENDGDDWFAGLETDWSEICDSGVVKIGEEPIFCDLLGGENRLVICGAGHVSIPVIRIGKMLGFDVTVIEDRLSFADGAKAAGADQVICDNFGHALESIEGDDSTYFVVVTRGHRYDKDCLQQILKKHYRYLGMIGSRRRVAMLKQALKEEGYSPEKLDAMHSPIGLDIGAETPEEIGVAIIAEIIEVKNKKGRTRGYSKEMIRGILDAEDRKEKGVLMTIITRKGSAPQGVGVKMFLKEDGTCIGTIGGGCMEAVLIQKARVMIRTGQVQPMIVKADLTGTDAEEDGMVCGGIVEVLMEPAGVGILS